VRQVYDAFRTSQTSYYEEQAKLAELIKNNDIEAAKRLEIY
jgi:hypothetical protein